MQQVYIEVLFIDNLMMNLAILLLSGRMGGWPIRLGRVLAASGAGALWAVLRFAPGLGFLGAWPVRIALGGAMAALALRPRSPRELARALCTLMAATLLVGGALMALMGQGGYLAGDGVLRLSLWRGRYPLYGLLLAGLVIRAALLRSRRPPLRARLRLEWEGRQMELTAVVDTGNLVTEPVSALPVVILPHGALPEDIPGLPVPYRTVGQSQGRLTAVRPQRLAVRQGGRWRPVAAYVACGCAGMDTALLPAALLE